MGMSIGIHLPGYNTDSATPYFTVGRDEKLLGSISSSSEEHSTAYEVDFSAHYDSLEDAYRAYNSIYANTSTFRANIVDTHMNQYYDENRSAYAYAGLTASYQPSNKVSLQSTWADFASDATYQRLLAQGGARTHDDMTELLTAAESYIWQRAYTENGVYKSDMFEFAARLKEATGVTVITQAKLNTNSADGTLGGAASDSNHITFGLSGSLARMDNYTFQAMARHQDHMDIWVSALNGTYSSFADITDAVMATDDEGLKTDWLNAITTSKGVTADDFDTESDEAVYKKYLTVSTAYSEKSQGKRGTTAQDQWDEFCYNTYLTNSYASKRNGREFYADYCSNGSSSLYNTSALDTIMAKNKIPHYYENNNDGTLTNPLTGETYRSWGDIESSYRALADTLDAAKKEAEGEQDDGITTASEAVANQIAQLREKIKDLREMMSTLQQSAVVDENTQKQISGYRQQIQSYQQQISTLQMQQLEDKKQHIHDSL